MDNLPIINVWYNNKMFTDIESIDYYLNLILIATHDERNKLFLDLSKDDFEILPFIGVYDEEQRPIFVGDIISGYVCVDYEWYETKGTVLAHAGGYILEEDDELGFPISMLEVTQIYKLGNVYENPELLRYSHE